MCDNGHVTCVKSAAVPVQVNLSFSFLSRSCFSFSFQRPLLYLTNLILFAELIIGSARLLSHTVTPVHKIELEIGSDYYFM